jgi:hypothetical protein
MSSQLLFSIRSLKNVIDGILVKAEFAVGDFHGLSQGLVEISRDDKANAVSSVEAFAVRCGFRMKYRDHGRQVVFYL